MLAISRMSAAALGALALGIRRPLSVIWLDTLLISATLIGFLTAMLALQWAGYDVGFSVWPLGEDRNWIDILQRGRGASAANIFWQINDRNPLSPWWYIIFRNFILDVDPGLLLLRYAIGLILALATYGLVILVAGKEARPFAIGVSIVIALLMANGYYDQIYWNFEAALVCSILSVICYAQFLNGSRQDYRWYGYSLVLWFLAFASYTIQCGAALAVACLAFMHPLTAGGKQPWRIGPALRAAIWDSMPYVVLFALFLGVWRTSARIPEAYALKPDVMRFLTSLKLGFWHYDLQNWWASIQMGKLPIIYYFAALFIASLVFIAVRRIGAKQHAGIITGISLLKIFCVGICIAAIPTVAIETAGVDWHPGTRWRMVYQFTQPMLFLGVIAAVLTLMPRYTIVRSFVWPGAVAVGAALAVLFTLATNQTQVQITRSERALRDALLRFSAENFAGSRRPPYQFLVKVSPQFLWYSSDLLSAIYAQTWFERGDISFRIIPRAAIDSPLAAYWPVRFGSDNDGVANAKLWDVTVSYDHVDIIEAQNERIERVGDLKEADLQGFFVRWERDPPIKGWIPPPSSCALSWSTENDALQRGWSVAEKDAVGAFRWTIVKNAEVTFSANCDSQQARLRVVIAYAVSERNLDQVHFAVNGRKIVMSRSADHDGHVYEGMIPAEALRSRGIATVAIKVKSLDNIPGADRDFGVAVRRVEVLPVASQ